MLFEQFKGDERQFTATVASSLDTGAKVLFAIKELDEINTLDPTDANAPLKKTLTSADAVDNGDGTTTYTVTITAADVASVPTGSYRAEVVYVPTSGARSTYTHFDYVLMMNINQRVA